MKAEIAKEISLVELLSSLGYSPSKIKKNGSELWFISPFRDEKTASFKVKKSENIWFDHGEGKGGNILDFVMSFQNIDFKGALLFLETTNLAKGIINPVINRALSKPAKQIIKEEDQRKIIAVMPVYSYVLKSYIGDRAIQQEIALQYLKELRYSYEGKIHYALAFRNRIGGWELRSSSYKGVIGAKDITVFENNFERVCVFEGFMDFLSYLTLKRNAKINSDFIILNSANMSVYAIEFLKKHSYKEVFTFLNNDNAGQKAFDLFKLEIPGCKSYNHLYAAFNDLNQFLIHKKTQHQKLN